MEMKDQPKTKTSAKANYTTVIIVGVMLICLAVIIATIELSKLADFKFIADHRNALVSIELAVFVIASVELIGQRIIVSFRKRGIAPVGYSIRTSIRGAAYIILTVGIISTLLSNPALALSLGTVIGVIIGFATQHLIGNVAAGMILTIVRPVQVGDEVTISGSTGCIKEIDLIYTILDTKDSLCYVPSIVMFSTVVIKKKNPGDKVT